MLDQMDDDFGTTLEACSKSNQEVAVQGPLFQMNSPPSVGCFTRLPIQEGRKLNGRWSSLKDSRKRANTRSVGCVFLCFL